MDRERQIRFLYPPLIFVAAVALAYYFDPNRSVLQDVKQHLGVDEKTTLDFEKLIPLIAGGSALVLVAGYLFGTMTVMLMRLYFGLQGKGFQDVQISSQAKSRIETLLNIGTTPTPPKNPLYASVSLDHELLDEGIEAWIVRRWGAYQVAANTVLALLVSIPTARLATNLHPTCVWYWVILVGAAVFGAQAAFCWNETIAMIEFQSLRPQSAFSRKEVSKRGGDPDDKAMD